MPGFFLPLIALTLSSPSYAGEPEVRALSEKYSRDMYPAEPVDAWWVKEKVLSRYLYMHAMVVAAFYGKREDQQNAAFRWLKGYSCENVIACRDFHFFVDGALKSNRLKMKKARVKEGEKIRDQANAKQKAMHLQLPPREGLCGPEAKRAGWLSLGYELFCPYVDRQVLKFKIETDSNQLVMSSSFLQSLLHQGPTDCSTPWKVELICGGGLERTYRFSCEKKGAKVECKE